MNVTSFIKKFLFLVIMTVSNTAFAETPLFWNVEKEFVPCQKYYPDDYLLFARAFTLVQIRNL
jgi:hypothetical protein